MAQRSRADKVEDGRKGAVRKIAQYGPDELNRAGRQAAWTKQHPGRNKSENPYLREKICQPTDLDRAKNFKAWTTPRRILASSLRGEMTAPLSVQGSPFRPRSSVEKRGLHPARGAEVIPKN